MVARRAIKGEPKSQIECNDRDWEVPPLLTGTLASASIPCYVITITSRRNNRTQRFIIDPEARLFFFLLARDFLS